MPENQPARCTWPKSDISIAYHDTEWGVPVHDDRRLFEAFTLGGAQAGLSWETVLKKRETYREVFAGFDPNIVARYGKKEFNALMKNPGIVRNKLKIESTINNAKAFLAVQKEFGSFDAYLWRFVDGKPVVNAWTTMKQLPVKTPLSEAVSKDLLKRGFRFVGPTICYATMQGIGMINDHLVSCVRREELMERFAR